MITIHSPAKVVAELIRAFQLGSAATLATASTPLTGLYTLNGHALAAGDIVAVVGQGGALDGVYTADAAAWTRTDKAATGSRLSNKIISISTGTFAGTVHAFTALTGLGIVGTDDFQLTGHGAAPQTADWPVFISSMPDGPKVGDDAICVYDTTGLKDGRLMRTGEMIVHEGFMVKLRACIPPECTKRAKQIAAYLDALHREELTIDAGALDAASYRIQSITRIAPILTLGTDQRDNKRRHQTSINATITIEEI